MSQQVSEELLQQIVRYLYQQHVQASQLWLFWVVAAPLVGLFLFLVMWARHRAHCPTLLDAIAFFFSPRGPYRMLVFKDLAGNRVLVYDYQVMKGSSGYLIQAGPYLLKASEDPEAYAEPVSLLDARGPPGVPSPFGLWARQLVAAYITLAIVAVSFANTFWITSTVYAPAIGATYTVADLTAFFALALTLSWFVATLLKSLSPQTLVVSLTAVGVSESYVEATPALDVYSSFPPSKLLRSISREPRIVVSDSVGDFLSKLREELGDGALAASLLAMLGQVYDSWRRSLGILLQDRYDISVAARAKYHLEETRLPRGFLERYAGLLAVAAIVIAAVVLVLWLQPAVVPATTTTPPTYYTPAPPPPPPT